MSLLREKYKFFQNRGIKQYAPASTLPAALLTPNVKRSRQNFMVQLLAF